MLICKTCDYDSAGYCVRCGTSRVEDPLEDVRSNRPLTAKEFAGKTEAFLASQRRDFPPVIKCLEHDIEVQPGTACPMCIAGDPIDQLQDALIEHSADQRAKLSGEDVPMDESTYGFKPSAQPKPTASHYDRLRAANVAFAAQHTIDQEEIARLLLIIDEQRLLIDRYKQS